MPAAPISLFDKTTAMNMKKTLRIALLGVTALALVGTGGYLTLSVANETNWATFGACLLFWTAGIVGRDRFFFWLVCGLLAAYILSAFWINWPAFFGPLTCLAFFAAGHLLQWRSVFKHAFGLVMAALVSFVLVPMYRLNRSSRLQQKSPTGLLDLRFSNPEGDTFSSRTI